MSQFAPTGVSVPAGFEELLDAVTREILRAQPADIVIFAAEYFKRKVTLRDEGYNPIVETLSKTRPSSIVNCSTSQLEDGRDSTGSGKESPLYISPPGDTNVVLVPHSEAASQPPNTNATETLSPHQDPDPPGSSSPDPDPFTGFSTPNLNSDPDTGSVPPDNICASPTPHYATSPPPETNHVDIEIPSDDLGLRTKQNGEEKEELTEI